MSLLIRGSLVQVQQGELNGTFQEMIEKSRFFIALIPTDSHPLFFAKKNPVAAFFRLAFCSSPFFVRKKAAFYLTNNNSYRYEYQAHAYNKDEKGHLSSSGC